MPNAKLKCCNCKDRFRREVMLYYPAGNFCSQDCIVEYAANKGKKAVKDKTKKDHALRKRVFYANDLKTRKAAAKKPATIILEPETKVCLAYAATGITRPLSTLGIFSNLGTTQELDTMKITSTGKQTIAMFIKAGILTTIEEISLKK